MGSGGRGLPDIYGPHCVLEIASQLRKAEGNLPTVMPKI
jgi:hypothetical protein